MAVELDQDQIRRYARHILLPDVGGLGQSRLLAATLTVSVGVKDADAAGIVALAYLAAAGVGTLQLAGQASGAVTASELVGGILFGTVDVGQPRIDAIRARVAAINPDVTVVLADDADDTDDADEECLEVGSSQDPCGALIAGGAAAIRALHRIVSRESRAAAEHRS